MYTEIIKIIEGGLNKDTQKVSNYARMLAENLAKGGDGKLSEKINSLLKNTKSQAVYLDQLVATPVDQETRLNIVDFVMPNDNQIDLVFSKQLENAIGQFVTMNAHQNILRSAGLDVNSSLLLYGPPGCGKTTIARYISKTLNLPLVVARLDSLVSSLLGNTSKNIRKVFEFASKTPCILFLDEFDAIAKARDDQHELGELKRVINSLLQNIDEFTSNNILIAATNHHELLDKAIWRRFNHIIEIGLPGKDEIPDLLELYFKNYECEFLSDSKKIDKAIGLLEGLSPANIRSIAQNTIAKNIISSKNTISFEDFIFQIFLSNQHGAYNQEQLINFLNTQGVAQTVISELCNISIRQVRNVLK
ncbi:AAA family ATPase [Mucilaginibacter sp. OK283]|jgi:SpoVK/Ycf46/Vps4 family AAA+-type ATPase|uniref:AAA family ATPase n=1 Tax=Mucilaginibacter sp. OK283 TaxID=1881049 RepID=UPI0008D58521|nr:ATP-binding protein [Mucilaginibacter sp. OK283]SEO35076.1 ATPase family associated with various cellular activities (AAA) [Mucilaginibacter sp. OK283]